MSNTELDRSAEKLVLVENTNIAKLIAHIAEMSERKLALEMGYKSLYEYCARRLNLSEGAVPARIHVANVARRLPQLLVALAEGRISLTVAGLIAAHVNENNVDKRSPTILQPAKPDEFNFRFSAGRDFKNKFERLAEVLGVENAQKHMADILEKALDIALEKKDPTKKLERRKKRERSSSAKSRSNEISKNDKPATSPLRFRSGCRHEPTTNASFARLKGGAAARAQDFKLSMCDPLASFTATTSDFWRSYARNTML